MMLWAVHISDGVLRPPWLVGGFTLAALLLWFGARRIRDEEVPRIAILTAAFFVSSLIHIRVGPTSIHLLLSGLIGVLLVSRAALAVFVGLLLQVLLMQHGGYYTLGINTCVMTAPALFCGALFHSLHRLAWIKTTAARSLLVACAAILWFMSGAYSLSLVCNTPFTSLDEAALAEANASLLDPWIVGSGLLFAAAAVVLERRLENTPEFPLGFFIGELSVLLTAGLNCVVLLAGGETHWPTPPLLLVIAHLPFAVIEGVMLGFVVGFLTKVKPEMLGITQMALGHLRKRSADENPVTPCIMVAQESAPNSPPPEI